MSIPYSYVKNANGQENVTALLNGELFTADYNHPNFSEIMDYLMWDDADESDVVGLFDVGTAVNDYFSKVSERVAVSNGQVLFDGDPVAGELVDHIIRLYEEKADVSALVLFLEKLMLNPQEHSRNNLYRWMKNKRFSITAEGNLLGYKGLRSDFCSSHAGPGIVNGVPQNGHLDNSPGNVLEMARSEVEFDPEIGCSTGLHVANWNYASSWAGSGGKIVEVHVNPRDIVSVPTDCYDEKMRVSRYVVARAVTQEYDSALVDSFVESEGESVGPKRDERGRFTK